MSLYSANWLLKLLRIPGSKPIAIPLRFTTGATGAVSSGDSHYDGQVTVARSGSSDDYIITLPRTWPTVRAVQVDSTVAGLFDAKTIDTAAKTITLEYSTDLDSATVDVVLWLDDE